MLVQGHEAHIQAIGITLGNAITSYTYGRLNLRAKARFETHLLQNGS